MSTPSPLVPKGSIQDPPKGRRNLPVLVFSVIGFHVAALGVALMIGCKPETSPKVDTGVGFVATNEPPPFVTDTSSLTGNAAPETNPYQMPAPPAAAPGTLLAGSSSNVPPIGSMPAPGFSTESETSGVPAVPIPANGGYRSPGGFADPIVPAVEPATSSMTEHKVKSGESFSTMAQHYGVSVNAIVAANPNLNPRRLQVGQIVMIPAPSRAPAASRSGTASAVGAAGGTTGSYAVKPGDTLTKIAANHGTTVKALKSLNGLKTDRINVGQKLKVPVKAAPAPERTSEPVSNPAPTNSTFGTVPPAGGPAPAVPVPSPSGL